MRTHKTAIYADHLACYVFAAQFIAGKKVIELGSGEGYGAQLLSMFSSLYKGVDISQRFTEIANKKQMYCPSSFSVSDLEKEELRLDEFDWVVSFETLEHIDNPEQILQSIANQGKNVVFSVPHNYPHRLHKRDFFSVDDVKLLIPPNMSAEYYILGGDTRSALSSEAIHQGNEVIRYIVVGRPK